VTAARGLAARLQPGPPLSLSPDSPLERPGATTARGRRPVKYTLLMDPADADALDLLLLRQRRITGRRVTKSQLIRGLLTVALTDRTVLDQVLDGLDPPGESPT